MRTRRRTQTGAKLPDILIFVPGIMGSALGSADGTRDVWNTTPGALARGLADVGSTLERLALPEDVGDTAADGPEALRPTGVVLGWQLWPGFYSGPGYGPVYRDLLRRGRAEERVRFFAYDWRLSNRYTAARLAAFVRQTVTEWRTRSGEPGARAVLVTHSMGGLVARYYLEAMAGHADGYVRRLITLGTPHSGSVKAVQVLAGGASALPGRWRRALTAAARTMPSMWQLLPTWRCVARGRDEPVRLADVALPGLADPTHRDRVRDAARFHEEIARAVADGRRRDYTLHVHAGTRQPTQQSLSVAGDVLVFHHSQRGIDHGGDGTVPRFAAIPPEWHDDAQARVGADRHGAIPNVAYVREQVWATANAVELGAVMAPPVELGLDVTEVAHADAPLPVRVSANRPHLRLVARVRDTGTDVVVAERSMRSEGTGEYSAELRPRPGVWRLEVATVGVHPQVSISDLVVVTSDEP
jgi:hypothetical protein